jgi:hypothetical protein
MATLTPMRETSPPPPRTPPAQPGTTLAERNRADGTRALLRTGSSVVAVGAVSLATIYILLGGIGRNGPHNNTGWFFLIVTLMSLPFGLMLLGLGVAKWFRNVRLASEQGNLS